MTGVEQRAAAKAKADEARLAIAGLRARLRSLPKPEAIVLAASILRSPEGHEDAMRLDRLLASVPGFGEQRVLMTLRHAGLSYGARRLRDLTERQRGLVADSLGLPYGDLRRGVPQPVVDYGQISSAAAALRTLRPDVRDPSEVARIVFGAAA